jgi:hypothetical protein
MKFKRWNGHLKYMLTAVVKTLPITPWMWKPNWTGLPCLPRTGGPFSGGAACASTRLASISVPLRTSKIMSTKGVDTVHLPRKSASLSKSIASNYADLGSAQGLCGRL